jgi:hypothetical protein
MAALNLHPTAFPKIESEERAKAIRKSEGGSDENANGPGALILVRLE